MKKISKNPRGSILIWTVLLGISLTTVFFFFSQRLNLNAAVQRKSLEQQNAQVFLESYADYLASLTFENLKASAGEIDYNGIKGSLTNAATQVKGALDANQTLTHQIGGGPVRVEWGLCINNEAGRVLEVEPIEESLPANCAGGYDQWAETKPSNSVTLTAGAAPVSYKITPIGTAVLYKKEWVMDLEMVINPKKTLSVERIFVPKDDL